MRRLDPGLGLRFYNELKKTEERIQKYPDGWMQLSTNTRRCRLETFPYGIIYQLRADEILIVAVAHLKRKPEYWKDRISSADS
ncbi:type II toxin-antitoxin system RelE/ParE family toxin [Cerasicoccus maritimus]|uniref:type II toxin-antitoxin system RelE/ParE family toxin n=1 Tax=Cerasicoccus maritimus TaxID=490089 RepID=UPI00285270E2|nr:type II toxin-antitoxin system RelE/ParE family toxin [Cerasicoccus maritimus]